MPGCKICKRWYLPPIPELCRRCGAPMHGENIEYANAIIDEPEPITPKVDLSQMDGLSGRNGLPPQLHLQEFGRSIQFDYHHGTPTVFRTPSGKPGVVAFIGGIKKSGESDKPVNWRDIGKDNDGRDTGNVPLVR